MELDTRRHNGYRPNWVVLHLSGALEGVRLTKKFFRFICRLTSMSGNHETTREEKHSFSKPELYDLSFAYSFNWERPEEQIKEALKVLLCASDNNGNSPVDRAEIMTNIKTKETEKEIKKRAIKESAALEAARIRWLLAINPNTPPPVLDHLTRNAPSQLLERIGEHPRAHSTTLARLATHSDSQVRAAVAENMNASMKTIWSLVKDPSPDVRLRLAESYTVPIAILRVLAEDENPYVADRAQKTLLRLMREVTDLKTA